MIDPKAFVVAIERGLHKGQRVRTRHGPGKIKLIWFGQEENAVVILDDGTQRDCGLEMDDVWPETKETMKMNVEQNYDAVEGKGEVKVKPRPLRRGDVLAHQCGDHYFIFLAKGLLILSHLVSGGHYGNGATVHDFNSLTREEAKFLCGGNPDCFRLVGRAKDVVTVKDPGE